MAIIPCNQLSLADVFSDCQDIYESDKPEFKQIGIGNSKRLILIQGTCFK